MTSIIVWMEPCLTSGVLLERMDSTTKPTTRSVRRSKFPKYVDHFIICIGGSDQFVTLRRCS